uniref:Uncharacterized protein n=1 Tax=Solanum tuberosum TaxID=4113 RepID=M1DPR3_SOLTU
MSDNERSSSQFRNNDDIANLHDVNEDQLAGADPSFQIETTPRKRERGIVITDGAAPSQATQPKLPPTSGKSTRKGKGHAEQRPAENSSDSMGIYDTHLTSSEFESEDKSGFRSLASVSEPEDYQTLQGR